jgi:tetratricopeptide (TPR) repeat protein
MRSIAAAYQWPSYLPPTREVVPLEPDRLAAYVGRYRAGADRVIGVENRNGSLALVDWNPAGTPLYATAQDTLVTTEREGQIVFEEDGSGNVTHVVYHFADDIGRLLGEPAVAERLETGEKVPLELLREGDIDAAVAGYVQIKQNEPDNPYVSEQRLNALGYEFLNAENYEAAIAVFGVNITLYPESGNCYDSMGEAALATGDREAALRYYRKAYRLDPGNSNAAKIIDRLKSEGVR